MSESKRYLDSEGFTWQVCEIPLADAPPVDEQHDAVSAGSLYFLSRYSTRVLRPYPRGWGDMSWEELDAMRRRAVPPAPTAAHVERA